MAIDEALALSVMKGVSPPVLRFYSWEVPSVTIGYFQKRSDINTSYCDMNSIPVVRRPTGGRAVLHGHEVTYSFSARTDHHPSFRNLASSYEILSKAFLKAFNTLGLNVEIKRRYRKGKDLVRNSHCFDAVSFGELVCEGNKIIGSAQRRMREGFIQQGSIPLEIDSSLMEKIFGVCSDSEWRLLERGSITGTEQIKEAILEGFQEIFDTVFTPENITSEERTVAEVLVQRKYGLLQWRCRR